MSFIILIYIIVLKDGTSFSKERRLSDDFTAPELSDIKKERSTVMID